MNETTTNNVNDSGFLEAFECNIEEKQEYMASGSKQTKSAQKKKDKDALKLTSYA